MNSKLYYAASALILVLTACSGATSDVDSTVGVETTEVSTPEPPAAVTTTAADGLPFAATEMPPGDYADVAEMYLASADSNLELGRGIAERFLEGDIESLYDEFSPEFSALVSLDQLIAGRTQLNQQNTLGDIREERTIQLGADNRFYAAEIGWGEGALTLNAQFSGDGEIAGLLLVPQPELPADPASDFQSEVAFRLPFDGLWFTFWGGDTPIQNYHVAAAVQRHAFDFLIWKDGGTHTSDGTEVEHYWAYGQQVLAPAAGTIVTLVDGLPDQVPQTGSDVANPAGNHVVIEVASGEYLLIAHIQRGSFVVAEGETVEAGQPIGLVGNSGSTSEPHIHIHLQDQPEFSISAGGLPLVFTEYLADGQAVAVGQPLADQFVASR